MKDVFGAELIPGDQVVTHLPVTYASNARRLVKAVVIGETKTGLLSLRLLSKSDRGYRSTDKLVRATVEVMYTGVHHSSPEH